MSVELVNEGPVTILLDFGQIVLRESDSWPVTVKSDW